MSRHAGRRRALGRAGVRVLAGVVALGVLGGCGPQRQEAGPSPAVVTAAPSVEPTSERTPDPSPTPSSIYAAPADAYVEPVRPAILDGKPSEDAAIAFAEYYLRLYTYAYLTGDAADLNALARAGCVFCTNVADDLAREFPASGHGEGGVFTVDSAEAHDYNVEGGFSVTLSVRQSPSRVLDAAGRVVTDNPDAARYKAVFVLFWTRSAGWRTGGVAVESA